MSVMARAVRYMFVVHRMRFLKMTKRNGEAICVYCLSQEQLHVLGRFAFGNQAKPFSVDNAMQNATKCNATPIEIANCPKATEGGVGRGLGLGNFPGAGHFPKMRTNVGTVIKPKDEQ